jgi:DNA-binding CsgD family transcriptional regulator
MKQAESIAHLRQLCCLGLDSEAVMPELLSGLRNLVPSSNSAFYWTDTRGSPQNVYQEYILPSAIQLQMEAYHLFQGANEPSIEALTGGSLAVGNIRRIQTREYFQRSNTHNLVCKPHGHRYNLDGIVRDSGKPRGMLLLFREAGGRDFSADDERMLNSLLPYFNHALIPATVSNLQYVNAEDSGVVIADAGGRVLHLTRSAHRLLTYVMNPRLGPGAVWRQPETLLPESVQRLCRDLVRIQAGCEAPPPAARIDNAWGRFSFHAQFLDAQALQGGTGTACNIAIVIRREEPLTLRIMRRLKDSPLSARQREVALRLALGDDTPTLRRTLGISAETLRDHVRKIYRRIEVHNRQQLISRLGS